MVMATAMRIPSTPRAGERHGFHQKLPDDFAGPCHHRLADADFAGLHGDAHQPEVHHPDVAHHHPSPEMVAFTLNPAEVLETVSRTQGNRRERPPSARVASAGSPDTAAQAGWYKFPVRQFQHRLSAGDQFLLRPWFNPAP
jgi:hypothetical protein